MPNEFSILTKSILDPQQESVRFSSTLQENTNIMMKLSEMLAVQSPEPGGQVERVQDFVTKMVPVGRELEMTAVITCRFKS